MSIPTTFYPQANLSAQAEGGALAPLQSGQQIRSTPTLAFSQFPTQQMSVAPQGNYSVAQGLALGQAAAAPFGAIADALSNVLDPVKVAQRKALLAGLANQTAAAQETAVEQPLTNLGQRALLQRRALALGVNPGAVQQAEPSLYSNAPGANNPSSVNPTGMNGSPVSGVSSQINGGSNPGVNVGSQLVSTGEGRQSPTLSGMPANVPTSNVSSGGVPAGQGYDAKGYPLAVTGLQGGQPGYNSPDAAQQIMAQLKNMQEPPKWEIDPTTQMPIIGKESQEHSRWYSSTTAAYNQMTAENEEKGFNRYAPPLAQAQFSLNNPGPVNPNAQKSLGALPSIVVPLQKVAESSQKLPWGAGSVLGDMYYQNMPFGPGITDSNVQAVKEFNSAEAAYLGAQAHQLNPRGLTNTDSGVASALAVKEPLWPWQASVTKNTIKQKIGQDLGQQEANLADFQKTGTYVNPGNVAVLRNAEGNLAQTLSGLPTSSNPADFFSPNYQNPLKPGTPSMPSTGSSIQAAPSAPNNGPTPEQLQTLAQMYARRSAADPTFPTSNLGKQIKAALGQ
jgi:hypothetical protein